MTYVDANKVGVGTVIYNKYVVDCKVVARGPVETTIKPLGWCIPVNGDTTCVIDGTNYITGRKGHLWTLKKPEHNTR